jgi:ArsR family transcriptional regulator, arsenate/arsenite/antimonite-responsive transcriptional repressor
MIAAVGTMAPVQQRVALFQALADETRLQILQQLQDGEQCVCDLTGTLGGGQSRLSFHLKTLKDAGLVTARREGRWIYYALSAVGLETVRDVVGELQPKSVSLRGTRRCE